MSSLRKPRLDKAAVSALISGSAAVAARQRPTFGAYAQRKQVSPPVTERDTPTPDEAAIVRAVLYASIFDFPLSASELRRTLTRPCASVSALQRLIEQSQFLESRVQSIDGWYVPAGRTNLVEHRRVREARSRAFLSAHRWTLDMICAVPFTRLVAISGSLAHLNADDDADLDLFVITRGPHVWTVALLIVLMAKVLRRRKVVCANFIVADSHLALDQHDLYTASQILHLRPVVGADTYTHFIAANPFTDRTFPNAGDQPASPFPVPGPGLWRVVKRVLEAVLWLPSGLLERLCRRAYGWHLRRKVSRWRSPEQVRLEPCVLKLHTNSHRRAVLEQFERLVADATRPNAAPRPRSGVC